MNRDITESLYKATLAAVLVVAMVLLTGCQSTENVLSGLDYACIDVQADGPWTDSGAQGRGVKVPDGETLTPELAEVLCQ